MKFCPDIGIITSNRQDRMSYFELKYYYNEFDLVK